MTRAEQAWITSILQIGCICCLLYRNVYSPPEVHHMLAGGRRRGHLFTLPLCYLHHRSGRNDAEVVSRDHNQRRFEARYGTEDYLLEVTRLKVQRHRELAAI